MITKGRWPLITMVWSKNGLYYETVGTLVWVEIVYCCEFLLFELASMNRNRKRRRKWRVEVNDHSHLSLSFSLSIYLFLFLPFISSITILLTLSYSLPLYTLSYQSYPFIYTHSSLLLPSFSLDIIQSSIISLSCDDICYLLTISIY